MKLSKIRLNVPSKQEMGNLLFTLHGSALAYWIHDLATTYYAIDIAKNAYETNQL
jgi:hypothetical protein